MSRYNKTLVALIPVLIAALEVLRNALSADDAISTQEVVSVLLAGATAAGVYLVPNKTPAGKLPDPNVSEQDVVHGSGTSRVFGAQDDLGAVSVGMIVVIVLAVLGVLFILSQI